MENPVQLAPSALHETAETLGGHLGWTFNELVIDDIVNLDGPHDRQIGMRLIGDGSTIQLWATGGTQPADHEPAEGIAPLPHGRRWHTWVHIGALEPDKDPGVVLYNAISDRLLPVFDTKPLYVGHRPWEEAFDSALSEVIAESTPEAGTSLRDSGPQAHTQPQNTGEDTEPMAEPEPAPEAAPEPEQQAPAEPTAKVIPMRARRAKPAADAEPKRPARKRAPAKPAADTPTADAAAEAKPRPTRKRAAKPATAAADVKAKRPARKRAPAKPATDKPTS
ncbi:hypothetical protein [Streptomyces sp. NPDC004721]